MRPGRGLVALALGSTLLLSACSAGADSGPGFDSLAQDSGMQRCVAKDGMGLDGAPDWTPRLQRHFLSKPAALTCALDELSPEQLRGAMRSAFDDASSTAVMSVLVDFVHRSRGAATTRSRAVGRLLGALDPDQFDPGWDSFPVRQQLAWATYQATGGDQRVYRRWLAAHPRGREAGPTPDVPFFKLLEDAKAGTATARVLDAVSSLSRIIDQAQEGDLS